MKRKNYVAPKIESVRVESESVICVVSAPQVSGSSGSFDS